MRPNLRRVLVGAGLAVALAALATAPAPASDAQGTAVNGLTVTQPVPPPTPPRVQPFGTGAWGVMRRNLTPLLDEPAETAAVQRMSDRVAETTARKWHHVRRDHIDGWLDRRLGGEVYTFFSHRRSFRVQR